MFRGSREDFRKFSDVTHFDDDAAALNAGWT
jgi:hypothetical protein